MVIDVKQTESEKKNEFEILVNNEKKYIAKLPFIDIKGSFNLEKLRDINIYDLNGDKKYSSAYNYFDNLIEELIPLKYVVTKSQKFYQLKFTGDDNEISIFFHMQGVWNGIYVIKCNNKIYNCYSVEDKYIRHVSIYNEDTQIGELLKPNLVIDGKDIYRIYLKDNYQGIIDAVAMLALYLDRTEYNSSYLKVKGKYISKEYSYSKINKYYDPNWVKNNFDSSKYFNEIDIEINNAKKEIKQRTKKLLSIIGIAWGIIILITIIILVVVL